jgi:hypothetical protein
MALAIAGLIAVGEGLGASVWSSAQAGGYVGPSPSSNHEEVSGPAFGHVEHPQEYVVRSLFPWHTFGSSKGVRKH